MNPTSTLAQQIKAARQRSTDYVEVGVDVDVAFRIRALRGLLKSAAPPNEEEIFRYIHVAACAALETHFRVTIARIIDKDATLLERGTALVKDRIRNAADLIPALHRKDLTAGDWIAYTLPFHNLACIEEAYSALLDADFKKLAADIRQNWEDRSEPPVPEPLVKDFPLLRRHLAELFERRHIVAHEAATEFSVSRADAESVLNAFSDFVEVTVAVLWTTVYRDEPLSQREMNDAAWRSYSRTRKELAEALKECRAFARRHKILAEVHRLHWLWKAQSEEWTELIVGEPAGSIWPLINASEREAALKARIEQVKGLTKAFWA